LAPFPRGGSETRWALLAAFPAGRAASVMCDRDDPDFVRRRVLEDAVGKPAKNMAASRSTEGRPDMRVCRNSSYGAVKFGHERKTRLGIRAGGMKGGGIAHLAYRERNNDQLHFSAARTCAKASAKGTT